MYTGLLHSHSGLRYLVLLLLVAVIVKSAIGLFTNAKFTKADKSIGLSLLITSHLQLVTGLVLYFVSPFVNFGQSDPIFTYWNYYHIIGMISSIVLITVAYSVSKRAKEDKRKFFIMFALNTAALAGILAIIYMSQRGIF